MDYSRLAAEFLEQMYSFRKIKPLKSIDESLQGEIFAINYIAIHGDDVLPGEISNDMDVSSARVAQTLNNLEKKGLITRRIDPNDRRKILVTLTPEGKTFSEMHRKHILETVVKMLEMLGEDDAREFVRIMARLVKIAPECHPFL